MLNTLSRLSLSLWLLLAKRRYFLTGGEGFEAGAAREQSRLFATAAVLILGNLMGMPRTIYCNAGEMCRHTLLRQAQLKRPFNDMRFDRSGTEFLLLRRLVKGVS